MSVEFSISIFWLSRNVFFCILALFSIMGLFIYNMSSDALIYFLVIMEQHEFITRSNLSKLKGKHLFKVNWYGLKLSEWRDVNKFVLFSCHISSAELVQQISHSTLHLIFGWYSGRLLYCVGQHPAGSCGATFIGLVWRVDKNGLLEAWNYSRSGNDSDECVLVKYTTGFGTGRTGSSTTTTRCTAVGQWTLL